MRITDWIVSNIFGSIPIIGPYLRHDFQTATSEAIKCIIVLVCENVGMYLIGHVNTPEDVALNTLVMIGGVTAGTITFNLGEATFNCDRAMLTQYRNSQQQIRETSATTDEEQLQLVAGDAPQRTQVSPAITDLV